MYGCIDFDQNWNITSKGNIRPTKGMGFGSDPESEFDLLTAALEACLTFHPLAMPVANACHVSQVQEN